MDDNSTIKHRYSQFFVVLLLGAFIYMMVKTAGTGINNFQDNFHQRDFLIERMNLFKLNLGDRVFPTTLIGKNGWMHYSGEGTIDDFQNTRIIDRSDEIIHGLVALDQYLKSQGITLLVTVAPNKSTIYPETMPDELITLKAPSRLDLLISNLNEANVPVLDLRPALMAAHQKHDIYYKTDSHWNGWGALAAYTAIINALHDSHPDLIPYKASELNYETTGPDVREIPSTMRINSITELNPYFAPRKFVVQKVKPGNYDRYDQLSWIPDSSLPTLLMFHDSFGDKYLDDYLSMNFSTSHFVHVAAMPQYLTEEVIQEFKPQVIVIEIVERNLHELILYYPDFMMQQ